MKPKNILKGLAGVLSAGALGFVLCAGSTRETGCETFKDYDDISDGTRVAVFGPNPDSISHALEVKYNAIGKDSEAGKDYKLKIKDYLFGGEMIVKATPCTPQ